MKKKYLIFGATGSIGSNLAKELYDKKEDCHLIGRNENEIKKLSEKFSYSYSVCDVLKVDFAKKLLEELIDVEILGVAYCVGSIDLKPFKLTKSSDFVSSYVLNLVSVTEIIRNFETNLKRNNGSIVLFSTVASKKGFINHSIISSAKSGVEGLARSAAKTYAKKNIRVNTVSPGLVDTPLSSKIVQNSIALSASKKMHTLGEIGKPKHISNMISFLTNPENNWITGQNFVIDGGLSSTK